MNTFTPVNIALNAHFKRTSIIDIYDAEFTAESK